MESRRTGRTNIVATEERGGETRAEKRRSGDRVGFCGLTLERTGKKKKKNQKVPNRSMGKDSARRSRNGATLHKRGFPAKTVNA